MIRFGQIGLRSMRRSGVLMAVTVAATAALMAGMTQQSVAQDGAQAASNKAEIGKPAPNFTLTDLNGDEHSLSDFKGKMVILEWFNPDCPYVKVGYQRGPLKTLGNVAESPAVRSKRRLIPIDAFVATAITS